MNSRIKIGSGFCHNSWSPLSTRIVFCRGAVLVWFILCHSFSLAKSDQRAVPFTSLAQYNEVRTHVLTTLSQHNQTPKHHKKRYRAALNMPAANL